MSFSSIIEMQSERVFLARPQHCGLQRQWGTRCTDAFEGIRSTPAHKAAVSHSHLQSRICRDRSLLNPVLACCVKEITQLNSFLFLVFIYSFIYLLLCYLSVVCFIVQQCKWHYLCLEYYTERTDLTNSAAHLSLIFRY